MLIVFRPPAPEQGATKIHTDVSPVLAQIFTEPFTVFSAKRFPGVPGRSEILRTFGTCQVLIVLFTHSYALGQWFDYLFLLTYTYVSGTTSRVRAKTRHDSAFNCLWQPRPKDTHREFSDFPCLPICCTCINASSLHHYHEMESLFEHQNVNQASFSCSHPFFKEEKAGPCLWAINKIHDPLITYADLFE